MLAQGALTIAIGVGAGLLASAALARFLATVLFEIAPTAPIIFCVLASLSAGVAVLACLAPAPRATRVDPKNSLVVDGDLQMADGQFAISVRPGDMGPFRLAHSVQTQ